MITYVRSHEDHQFVSKHGAQMGGTLGPGCKVHVLSKENLPYMRADLISGLLACIRISDWDQPKLTLHAKRPYIRGPYKRARV